MKNLKETFWGEMKNMRPNIWKNIGDYIADKIWIRVHVELKLNVLNDAFATYRSICRHIRWNTPTSPKTKNHIINQIKRQI